MNLTMNSSFRKTLNLPGRSDLSAFHSNSTNSLVVFLIEPLRLVSKFFPRLFIGSSEKKDYVTRKCEADLLHHPTPKIANPMTLPRPCSIHVAAGAEGVGMMRSFIHALIGGLLVSALIITSMLWSWCYLALGVFEGWTRLSYVGSGQIQPPGSQVYLRLAGFSDELV